MSRSEASSLSRSSSIRLRASRTAHSAHRRVAAMSRPSPRRSSSLPSRIPHKHLEFRPGFNPALADRAVDRRPKAGHDHRPPSGLDRRPAEKRAPDLPQRPEVRTLEHWHLSPLQVCVSQRCSTRRVSLILWVPQGNITSCG